MDMSLSEFQEMVKDREAWNAAVMGSQSLTQLCDWTIDRIQIYFYSKGYSSVMNWMLVSPKSISWILILTVVVFGGGAFRRWRGHKSGALMNRISALFIKETSGSSFPPFAMRGQQSDGWKQEVSLQMPNLLVSWSYTLQPPQLWEINVCGSYGIQAMVLCYNSPIWLRYHLAHS